MGSLRFWPLALAAALITVVIAGCGGSSSSGSSSGMNGSTESSQTPSIPYKGVEAGLPTSVPQPKPGSLKIAIASPLEANEAVHIRSTAAQDEVEALGGSATVYDAEATPDKQVSQIEQAISSGANAIIVEAVDPRALAPVLRRTSAAHIPVVGIDINLDATDPGPGFSTQIYTGRDLMAYDQAKEAASLLAPGSPIGLIGFAVPVPQLERMVEQESMWAKKFGLDPVGEAKNPSDEIAGGEEAMTQLINQHPEIEGVIAYNDASAVGAASAARAAGKSGLVLIGNNGESLGIEAVKQGKIAATVQVSGPDAAKLAVWSAYDLAQGTKVPNAVEATPPKVIDQSTTDIVTWDELLKERYGK
jgi:ribose transport system substrate-binding protein